MSPRISVLMPARNESANIVAAITSVLSGTVQDLQVIVADGASTDDTREKVLKLAAEDHRVVLVDNVGRTIPHGLNRALAVAEAPVVARVDAHSHIEPDYLELGLVALEAHPECGGVGGIRLGTSDTRSGRAVAAALASPFGVGNSINHYAKEASYTDHASFGMYRTEAARAIGGWDETLPVNEDVDFDHRLMEAGHRIWYDPQMRTHWKVQESLRGLCRQYRRYGRGKAAMVRKNGRGAVQPRHLVAPGLVGYLGASLTLATRYPGAGLTLAGLYPAAMAVTAAKVAQGSENVRARDLWRAFMGMHLSWGVGFLEGLVLKKEPALGSPPVGARSGNR